MAYRNKRADFKSKANKPLSRLEMRRSVFVIGCSLAFVTCVRAHLLFELYPGKAFNGGADVTLREPAAGTDIVIHNVPLEDKSFELPFYWGSRLSYFVGSKPACGVALDFMHAKAIGDTAGTAYVRGRWRGEPVEGTSPIRRYLSRLELSHGNNLFLIEGIICYRPRVFSNRAELYGGGGAGPALLHVEVTTPTQKTFEYRWDWCWGVLGGGRFWIWRRVALFGEYKFTGGTYELALTDGTATLTSAASHATAGFTVKLL